MACAADRVYSGVLCDFMSAHQVDTWKYTAMNDAMPWWMACALQVQAVHVKAFTSGRKPLSLAQAMAESATKGIKRPLRNLPSSKIPAAPSASLVGTSALNTASNRHDGNNQNSSSSLHPPAESKQPANQGPPSSTMYDKVSNIELMTQVWHEQCDGDGGCLSITVYTSSGCILGRPTFKYWVCFCNALDLPMLTPDTRKIVSLGRPTCNYYAPANGCMRWDGMGGVGIDA